jgi:hypothetical protein
MLLLLVPGILRYGRPRHVEVEAALMMTGLFELYVPVVYIFPLDRSTDMLFTDPVVPFIVIQYAMVPLEVNLTMSGVCTVGASVVIVGVTELVLDMFFSAVLPLQKPPTYTLLSESKSTVPNDELVPATTLGSHRTAVPLEFHATSNMFPDERPSDKKNRVVPAVLVAEKSLTGTATDVFVTFPTAYNVPVLSMRILLMYVLPTSAVHAIAWPLLDHMMMAPLASGVVMMLNLVVPGSVDVDRSDTATVDELV